MDGYECIVEQQIFNIINTLPKDRFRDYITKSMHTRENNLVQNKWFSVVVIPQFINVLTDSNNISVSKGEMQFFMREQSKRQIIDIDTETDNHLLELAREKIEQLDIKTHKAARYTSEVEDPKRSTKGQRGACETIQAGYMNSDGEPK